MNRQQPIWLGAPSSPKPGKDIGGAIGILFSEVRRKDFLMAIISPQRNAILSFEGREEAVPLWSTQRFYYSGGPIYPAGISKGINSKKPAVLVFSEKGPALDIEDEELKDCDYAVLLREPDADEQFSAAKQVGSTALETVELLTNTEDELCLERTGIAETYSKIS